MYDVEGVLMRNPLEGGHTLSHGCSVSVSVVDRFVVAPGGTQKDLGHSRYNNATESNLDLDGASASLFGSLTEKRILQLHDMIRKSE